MQLWRRYMGSDESRALHLTLLGNCALFAASCFLIARHGEALLLSGAPLMTQQEAMQAATQPLAPPPGAQ